MPWGKEEAIQQYYMCVCPFSRFHFQSRGQMVCIIRRGQAGEAGARDIGRCNKKIIGPFLFYGVVCHTISYRPTAVDALLRM